MFYFFLVIILILFFFLIQNFKNISSIFLLSSSIFFPYTNAKKAFKTASFRANNRRPGLKGMTGGSFVNIKNFKGMTGGSFVNIKNFKGMTGGSFVNIKNF